MYHSKLSWRSRLPKIILGFKFARLTICCAVVGQLLGSSDPELCHGFRRNHNVMHETITEEVSAFVGFCMIWWCFNMFQLGEVLGMHQECLLYPSFPLKNDVFGASGPPMDHADQSGCGEWHSGSSMCFFRNSLQGVVQSRKGAELWQFVVHNYIHEYAVTYYI